MTFDITTVVFQQELFFLKLQARSIHNFIDSSMIDNIYVVLNDDDIEDQIDINWWQSHSSKVKIIKRNSLGVNYSLHGWYTQQAYKILSCNYSKNWNFVLDARTFFIRSLDVNYLFVNNKANFNKFPVIEQFNEAHTFIENFYNTKFDDVISPGGPPFMFHSATVRNMISTIEQKSFVSFFNFFGQYCSNPIRVTEFMLYSGYTFKENLFDELYTNKQHYDFINVADFQINEFDYFLEQADQCNILTLGIHRRIFPLLSDKQTNALINVLSDKDLLEKSDIDNLLNFKYVTD